jgi:DNA polymerase-3 subunit beta
MTKAVDQNEVALAMYRTACESHMRRDWREACHALAKALMATAARIDAMPAQVAPVAPAPSQAPVAAPKAPRAPKAAKGYDMTAEGLTRALRVLNRIKWRGDEHICAHVLFVARNGTLSMTRTDLERAITVTINEDLGEWAATCEARRLTDMLAKARGPLTLSGYSKRDSSELVVTGAVTVTLQGRSIDDWPDMAPQAGFELLDASESIYDALAYVAPHMSTEETRYYLKGAALRTTKVGLDVVATDGHTLARVTLKGQPMALDAILTRDFVGDVLATQAPDATLTIGPNFSTMRAGPVLLVSKLIDYTFPDYERVIPAKKNARTLDRLAMLEALERVMAVRGKEKEKPVKLTIADGACVITCRSLDGVALSESIPCHGADLEVGFAGPLLVNALRNAKGERVTLDSETAAHACRVADGMSDRVQVIMPTRI